MMMQHGLSVSSLFQVKANVCMVVISGLSVTEGRLLFGRDSLYVCEVFAVCRRKPERERERERGREREREISLSFYLTSSLFLPLLPLSFSRPTLSIHIVPWCQQWGDVRGIAEVITNARWMWAHTHIQQVDNVYRRNRKNPLQIFKTLFLNILQHKDWRQPLLMACGIIVSQVK